MPSFLGEGSAGRAGRSSASEGSPQVQGEAPKGSIEPRAGGASSTLWWGRRRRRRRRERRRVQAGRVRSFWRRARAVPKQTRRRREKKGEKEGELDLKRLLSQDSGKMMQLMMMSLLMEKSDKKKQKARSFHELRGSSSSESSGSEDEVAGKGMKAVLTLQQLHRQVHRKPLRVCQLFEKEVTEELGIVAGQAWTLKDYIKKQNWGRYKGLQRCAVMDVAAYELIRAGKPDIAAAQLVHNMKAKIQAVPPERGLANGLASYGVARPPQSQGMGRLKTGDGGGIGLPRPWRS